MGNILGAFSFKKRADAIEWRLLLFLVLFMDVKLVVKLAAIILIYLLQPDLRFGFRIKNSRLPVFYLTVIAIGILNWLIYQDLSVNYSIVICAGILSWIACILAIHQVKLFVEKTDTVILQNTLLVFFVLNIAVSLFNLSAILWEIGLRNPFHYQGDYQKYFVNTGDHIKGISFDSSTTNALINSFGIIYFLYQRKYLLMIACMIILILTASNFTNAILLLVFALLFLFKSTRDQKSVMAICIMLLIVFLGKFSPQNDYYINEMIDKFVIKKNHKPVKRVKQMPIRETPDSLLDTEGKKEKFATLYLDSLERERLKENAIITGNPIQTLLTGFKERPEIPGDSIHTAKFQWKRDTTTVQRQILSYAESRHIEPEIFNNKYTLDEPGKLAAFRESYVFFKAHPQKIITGEGIGNFSSKLAFRATNLKIAGGYPQKYVYNHPDFLANHFSLYSFFFTKNAKAHSLINSPFSVYDQLFTEYGLLGLSAFFIFYIGFFLRRIDKMTYSIPLLVLMLAAFTVDYWFEQLSIVLLFELMVFMDIKINTKAVANG